MKYRGEIKQILNKQLEASTNDFVEFFHNAIKTQIAVKDFRDVVKRAFNEFVNEMNKKEPNKSKAQHDNENDIESNVVSAARSKPTNIKVTMPDGSVLYHHSGKKTYLDVLEKLGLEKVMQVRPDIVSKEQFSQKSNGVKRGEYWVRGAIRLGGTKP